MSFDDIISILKKQIEGLEVESNTEEIQPSITIDRKKILKVCNELHTNETLFFDHLSCLSGMDNGEDKDLGVVYHLYSIPFDLHFVVKCIVPKDDPTIDSITSIWKGADWHEREAFDMFGIKFINHPDLRRILMPADWEGYPLRKDYKEQEKYRGIKVEY